MSEILPIDPYRPDDHTVNRAVEILRRGGLVVYPTETLYGIGADATNPAALARIAGVKARTTPKPILVIVDSVAMMSPFVREIPAVAKLMIERLWPGPLTLVFKATERVPVQLSQGTGTIGIRISPSQLCLKLLSRLGVPLTSTSANISGAEPSRTLSGVQNDLAGIDLFLDAGQLPESQPSTVVDVSGDIPRVVRQGAISINELRRIVTEIAG